jgi:hypothetical protein
MRFKTLVLGFCGAGALVLLAAGPALAALSASATISTSQNSGPFNYTINLTNTGTIPISTFWFAWTPPGAPTEYSLLPSVPSAVTAPANWLDPVIGPPINIPGYSIEYYDSTGGTNAIQPGNSALFGFTSNDSPTTLLGNQFGFIPILTSTIYAGFPLSATQALFTVNVTAAPEPSSFLLAGIGAVGLLVWRRKRFAGA